MAHTTIYTRYTYARYMPHATANGNSQLGLPIGEQGKRERESGSTIRLHFRRCRRQSTIYFHLAANC